MHCPNCHFWTTIYKQDQHKLYMRCENCNTEGVKAID